MKRSDKILYHQIHPLKLGVDIAGGLTSTWLLWRHQLLVGMLVAWLPSVAVSVPMILWMDFSRQRDSAFGRYVAFHRTRTASAVRLVGQAVMWIGAWYYAPWAILFGALVILAGWTYSWPRWPSRHLR